MSINFFFIIFIILTLPILFFYISKINYKKQFTKKSISLIFSILAYVFLLSFISYEEYILKEDLKRYDLNNDGVYSGKEITPKQKIAMDKVVNDTARNVAPFTGIILCFFYFLYILVILTIVDFLIKKYNLRL